MNIPRCARVALALFLALAVAAPALAEPIALATTHYMAANVKMVTENNSATDGTVGNITGPMGVPIVFRTFDQLTCNAGKYDVVMRIVKVDTNEVVASTKPVSVTAGYDGYIHSQPAVWRVLFPAVGWYRYEIFANDKPVVYYYFIVSFIV